MDSRLKRVDDVAAWRLCQGCGACAYICPEKKIRLTDFVDEGIRPEVEATDCGDCRACVDVCPGTEATLDANPAAAFGKPMADLFGPILEIWEGHAGDPEIRYRGSSGGLITALSLYCIERGGMEGVLHTGRSTRRAWQNSTRLSRSRAELLAAAGSRYSPASVCDGLGMVEAASKPCVVVGQPSEITALRKAMAMRPALKDRVGVSISFFCAGSPSTRGTLNLLQELKVPASEVADLRYRGYGWPGHFAPTRIGDSEPGAKIPYGKSWGFLQAYRPWAIHLWPDCGGEHADLSCGDPWHQKPDGVNPGSSMVVVRTEAGRRIVREAMAAGYVELTPSDGQKLLDSQKNLMDKKRTIWGRQMAMRMFGLPVTEFRGVPLKELWGGLGFREKAKAFVGTARRVFKRKLYRPQQVAALKRTDDVAGMAAGK